MRCILRVFRVSLPHARLEERWAQISLHVALSCSSRHYAGRSLQVWKSPSSSDSTLMFDEDPSFTSIWPYPVGLPSPRSPHDVSHADGHPVSSRRDCRRARRRYAGTNIFQLSAGVVSTHRKRQYGVIYQQGYVAEIMLTLETAVDSLNCDFHAIDATKDLFKSTPNLNDQEPGRRTVGPAVGQSFLVSTPSIHSHTRSTSYSTSHGTRKPVLGSPTVERRGGKPKT